MAEHLIHAEITGRIVVIGMGSIGRGVLPLLERHIKFDPAKLTVIDPDEAVAARMAGSPYAFVQKALTPENYAQVLGPLLDATGSFCINLSVDTGSRDLIDYCRSIGALYIDTVAEPWPGFYFGDHSNAARTNYRLRQSVRDLAAEKPGGPTAVNCCGANPGMVSWFVKEALLLLAADLGLDATPPDTRAGWARLMQAAGVHGIHIAERDTQVARTPRPRNVFVNTWSVEGFLSEGFQPAELGWGTAENWMPDNAARHDYGCRSAIWLDQPGANTRVRTWCPSRGAQFGLLVTHNEAISIADYFTVGAGDTPDYRPTCHYAYHPCDDAILSLYETFGTGRIQTEHHILEADEIADGVDELGVLLFGHAKNALWYGSRLSNAEAMTLAADQNATGLQVTSAVLAGVVWALENPEAGIVEAEEMDHARCLEIQKPYLGPVEAHYTDWTPLVTDHDQFPQDRDPDPDQPWSFRNVLQH